jgi:hypothetical protein
MKPPIQARVFTPLKRRHWLALALSSLTGCGGGGGSGGFTGLPGTGGTGVYAQGSIAGFGSIILNGIKFDDTAATVVLNGNPATASELRLGMVANVQGTRGADLTLGVANQIEVWSVAQGAISQLQSNQFSVAGMVVVTDTATVFDGISGTAALTNGQRVTVWALQSGADGSHWTATRVALTTATAVISTGLVVVSGSQRTLHGLTLSGTGVSGLVAGQLVRVQGAAVSNGTGLQVDSIKVLDATSTALQGDAEVEGLITAVLSATRFMLGNVEVDASTATVSGGSAYTVGARVEVEGQWQNRAIKAKKVSMEGSASLEEAEIEGRIEQFVSLANFTLRSQRCDGSAVKQIGNGKVSDLKVGVKVKVTGTKSGDVLKLTSIEISS